MKTLAITDGDLRIGGRGYALASGLAKTVQDLGIALREALGVDRFHPRWGSELPGLVGQVADEMSRSSIEGEVYRIVNNYIAIQREQIQMVRSQGASGVQIDLSEILDGVEDVTITDLDFGRFRVVVTLRALDNQRLSLTSTI